MGSIKQFEHVYKVKGMHCSSCEILLEKKIIDLSGVTSVDASTGKGEVKIGYTAGRPTTEQLNKIFKEENYQFSDIAFKKETPNSSNKFFWIVLAIVLFFIYLNRSGFASLVNVSSASGLASFFMFGVLAGISTCAALVGGLVLSMSKQWLGLYAFSDSWTAKIQPHLMFNFGRLVFYGLGGAILGVIGSKLQLSPTIAGFLVILVSVFMIFMGLQMLGVSYFQKFQLRMPRALTRKISDEKKFSGKYMPFVLGGLTFFLPCGFTLTSQGVALLSGSWWQGGLVMLFFALGTMPSLLLIGLSSVKFAAKPHLAGQFLKTAGALVLFFALFNINSQMNVLGWTSFSDLAKKSLAQGSDKNNDKTLPPIVNGKQVIKMQASSLGYSPALFKVRAGVPVRWEIQDLGTSGCTNAIIARSLFAGQISLTPGKTAVKEFTPQKAGRYKFSCWMGMVNGVIEVVNN